VALLVGHQHLLPRVARGAGAAADPDDMSVVALDVIRSIAVDRSRVVAVAFVKADRDRLARVAVVIAVEPEGGRRDGRPAVRRAAVEHVDVGRRGRQRLARPQRRIRAARIPRAGVGLAVVDAYVIARGIRGVTVHADVEARRAGPVEGEASRAGIAVEVLEPGALADPDAEAAPDHESLDGIVPVRPVILGHAVGREARVRGLDVRLDADLERRTLGRPAQAGRGEEKSEEDREPFHCAPPVTVVVSSLATIPCKGPPPRTRHVPFSTSLVP